MTTGLLISAIRSGAGKTTVTLGLLAALARRGVRLRAAKAGPDYIDPAFHAAATGAPCVNLDSWTMQPSLLQSLMAQAGSHADLVVVEGVMGLFDGLSTTPDRSGTSASIAARFRLPVILVLDVTAQAQSAAAVVRGFVTHDPNIRIAGVVLNRVGSARHQKSITDAIAALNVPVVGAIPRDAAFALPERHLGLVQADEHGDLASRMAAFADMAEQHLDLDAIRALAEPIAMQPTQAIAPVLPPPGQRIALAADAAFSFVYPHLIDGWRAAGAEIVRFSPLADKAPPAHCDSCWLPGGYPELHAGTLAAAANFRDGLRHFAATRPVHGECGGYMVLGQALEDADGHRHAMTGLLSHTTSFHKRKLHLGYREARLLADSVLGATGTIIRGHEFHYASLTDPGHDTPLVDLVNADGESLPERGGRRGSVTGTFFHAIAQV
jgi:cobyrinic acid a,c-diamide synthase